MSMKMNASRKNENWYLALTAVNDWIYNYPESNDVIDRLDYLLYSEEPDEDEEEEEEWTTVYKSFFILRPRVI